MVDRFWRDGFTVVPVFTSEEVAGLRDRVDGLAADRPRTATGDLFGDVSTFPGLHHVLLDPRILRVAREILGAEPVYFRDSNVSIGEAVNGWHKDNRQQDRLDQRGDDWDGRYPIVRMGIYLQDHLRHSGGLSVRAGSHEPNPEVHALKTGRPVHVDSGVGDVAVWNLRTTHSGGTVRVRGLRGRKLSPRIERSLPGGLRAPEQARRLAIFFTFGVESPALDRYVDYLRTRDYFADVVARTTPCDEFVAAVAHADVTFRDPGA